MSKFFFMRERLEAAEQQAHGGSPSGKAAFVRALAAREGAEAVLTRSRSRSNEDDLASACLLLKDSLWWAIVAVSARTSETTELDPSASPSDAWAALEAQREASGLSAFSEEEQQATRRAFVERASFEIRGESPDQLAADLAGLRRGLDAVLAAPTRDAMQVARLRMVRRLRWIVALLIPLGAAVGIASWRAAAAREVNFALHKPTKASGQHGSVKGTKGVVDGKIHGIGFHTAREARPWLRIDLQEVKEVRQITVYNSDHCCFERAVPLVISVSVDGKNYQQVARREDPFGVWEADVGPVDARFVKLYVDKTTLFHLSEVKIR